MEHNTICLAHAIGCAAENGAPVVDLGTWARDYIDNGSVSCICRRGGDTFYPDSMRAIRIGMALLPVLPLIVRD